MKKASFFYFIALVAFIMVLGHFSPRDNSDDPSGKRSGLIVYVDALTGCQYVRALMTPLTPRMTAQGKQLCSTTGMNHVSKP